MTDYPRFHPSFAEALDRRLHSIEHLDDLLFSGRAQIWFGDEAAIVTEIPYPTGACVSTAPPLPRPRRGRGGRSRDVEA